MPSLASRLGPIPLARRLALAAVLALLRPAQAFADPEPPRLEPSPAPSGDVETGIRWGSAALFTSGFATAFLMHESCHAVANFALGNAPHIEPVTFAGAVPFFSVAPDITCEAGRCSDRNGRPFAAGTRGLAVILTAGIQCQHLADEVILTNDPALIRADAPFRKGMLVFNTGTSIAYVLANWLGVEPAAGDLSGLYRSTSVPRTVMNAAVLGIAALDLARYAWPDATWLAWASRASKLAVSGITLSL